jgi:hypothetical protein
MHDQLCGNHGAERQFGLAQQNERAVLMVGAEQAVEAQQHGEEG